ncbi:hypothetical protein ACFLYE_04165 [Chloroflexota bacterium]
MTELDSRPSSQPAPAGDAEAIRHLKQAIASGKHWYLALLEAIGLWSSAEEIYHERRYRYLVAGEAFDWLLLAERMCEAVDGLVPHDEKNALLFHDETPLDITIIKFKELIGSVKYRQYLNYFYGVTVEEALIQVVQEEVRKERWNWGFNGEKDTIDEVYRRIYGATKDTLLRRFRQEKGYRQPLSISLTELKEFTYWLFKYRLEQCDKARIASDTKKGLEKLGQMRKKSV